jgi:hypothetical protein
LGRWFNIEKNNAGLIWWQNLEKIWINRKGFKYNLLLCIINDSGDLVFIVSRIYFYLIFERMNRTYYLESLLLNKQLCLEILIILNDRSLSWNTKSNKRIISTKTKRRFLTLCGKNKNLVSGFTCIDCNIWCRWTIFVDEKKILVIVWST